MKIEEKIQNFKQREEKMQAEFLNEFAVSEMTGISLSKLRNDRFLRRGIPYHKVGKSVRYAYADIKLFMEECRICFSE